METEGGLNLRELRRYIDRVGDRWPVEEALLGGARVADEHGAPPQRERGPEFIVIFVSEAFDGVPWLERVYQAGSLWDAMEMGGQADVHCYTPDEFERKRTTLRSVRETVQRGVDLRSQKR
ncbi:MAG: BolA family transcriptional regulator [Actinomycetota bacterium]|nr:BolA family transcriptional regulator [Actinomycetota bacterium]